MTASATLVSFVKAALAQAAEATAPNATLRPGATPAPTTIALASVVILEFASRLARPDITPRRTPAFGVSSSAKHAKLVLQDILSQAAETLVSPV